MWDYKTYDLKAAYDRFNCEYFAGLLPSDMSARWLHAENVIELPHKYTQTPFSISKMKDSGLIIYNDKTFATCVGAFYASPPTMIGVVYNPNRTTREVEQFLLHEMVHVDVIQSGGSPDHGPRFQARCKQIEARSGYDLGSTGLANDRAA